MGGYVVAGVDGEAMYKFNLR